MVSDSDLVIKMHNNEVAAFDVLYWKYHEVIYNNILRFTKNSEVSRDILQDVFSMLWERRMDIDYKKTVSGWLFVVSFNQSVSYLRKKLRESSAKTSIIALTDVSDEPDSRILEHEYELLESAILKLSSQKRRVVTLCKLEGRSYEAAAQEMNISKHTVKEYLSAAMVSIKSFIKEHKGGSEIAIMLWFLLNQYPG